MKSRRLASLFPNFAHITPGAAPGEMEAQKDALPTTITVVAYNNEWFEERVITDLAEIDAYGDQWKTVWIRVCGYKDVRIISQLGERFRLHPLAMEDVFHTHQRNKVDHYEDYAFVVAKKAARSPNLCFEQVNLFIRKKFLLTFSERPTPLGDTLINRINVAHGKFRSRGPDYLAYAILDGVIDGYLVTADSYSHDLEVIEQEILHSPKADTIPRLHHLKSEIFGLRSVIWPMRDTITSLRRETEDVISDETGVFLRDCQDHTLQLLEVLESQWQLAASLVQAYLAFQNNRMNEVVKLLTLVSAIFIPLNFIASIYGMNFNTNHPYNMPELNWDYGYPAVLALMSAVALGLVWFFKRKGWLRNNGGV
ncbi:MAG: magnesium/cobalt transporter CorA [Alphaproteobacteria bacterium]|nr:magnesium/cobalt transporter CorA [Alphaproteobacteria bacterium]